MTNVDDMVALVRSALSPGADSATRQQAALLLRNVVAVLEAAPGSPLTPPAAAVPAAQVEASDLLGALVEKFRPMLPPEISGSIPRLNFNLIRPR